MAGRKNRTTERTAVVAGASGLVGRELIVRLARAPAYGRVIALTRRALGLQVPKLIEAPARFDALDDILAPLLRPSTVDAYCCLGATIRAAGSQQAFRRVDQDLVLAFARWAARRTGLVAWSSSVRSEPTRIAASSTTVSRVKRRTICARLQVHRWCSCVPACWTVRAPNGAWGESLALTMTRPLRTWLPASLRPVAVEDVAQSMIDAALAESGPAVLESAALQGAARRAEQSAGS